MRVAYLKPLPNKQDDDALEFAKILVAKWRNEDRRKAIERRKRKPRNPQHVSPSLNLPGKDS